MQSGFLFIDKPTGVTSHDIVSQARRILRQRRIGHTGTLDPFASGLLILCIGYATRLSEYLLHADKIYRFEIILGATSDTYDRTGNITPYSASSRLDGLSIGKVEDVIKKFIGEVWQTPPIYSALKVRGEPLYKYARAGKSVSIPPRKVFIHYIKVIEFTPPSLWLEARVGGGTYIRSLGNDIGKSLGVGGYLNSLRRIAIGRFNVKDAEPLEVFEKNPDAIQGRIFSITEVFPHWEKIVISGEPLRQILHGNPISAEGKLPLPPAHPDEPILVLEPGGTVICIANLKKGGKKDELWLIQPTKVLYPKA